MVAWFFDMFDEFCFDETEIEDHIGFGALSDQHVCFAGDLYDIAVAVNMAAFGTVRGDTVCCVDFQLSGNGVFRHCYR